MNLTTAKNWRTVKLGDIMNIFTGKKDVNQTTADGKFVFFSCSPETFRSVDYICDDAALIIAGNGSYTGTVRFFEGKFDLYQRTYGCTIKDEVKDEYDIKYIFYQFKKGFERDYMGGSRGSSIPYIVRGDIENYEMRFPESLDEQREIAGVLGCLDDKIELLRKENKTLESIAQTLFKEWFVDFRFPNATGQMVDSELGEIPEGWRVGKLGEVGEIVCGKTPSKLAPEYFGGDVPFIKIPDMHNQMFIFTTEDSLTGVGANSQNNKYIPEGSLCVSCIATVGLVSITTQDSQTNQQINSIVPSSKNTLEYLYFVLNSKREDLQMIGGGSATLNVNTGVFSRLEIILPGERILGLFHEATSPIFQKIKTNSKEIQTLSKLRDDLLNKIFLI
ncbi:MAG: hypothetical protein A2675_03220 [Candidatus Yonathbacteria bacterium RIFCSPHIGHO2_01_FULL_51_10]|uniref:Type I restriction modification DNA specificity domain-containing protein n=1 Tax=Candidatus Yonathbacteria bacterium RIFCSPHIGHO2_01_FULL_51_10 TaxID=1802723 RepID=A0A1G2S3L1_9BACT|nr:MAG: hypothetical protein A2675_03220 [Candidatus Yonathbacteria bacterium RIFCSPHIGHO2_01_FULL_51_10]